MTFVRRTAAAAAAAAAMLAFLPGAAASAATPRTAGHAAPAGTFLYAAKNVPSSVRRGTTFTTRIWYMERSSENMWLEDYLVELAPVPTGGRSLRGVTVRLLSPITHTWQNASSTADGDYWFTPKNGAHQTITPGYWAHLDVQITIGRNAATGPWQLIPEVIGVYQMATRSGTVQNIPMNFSGANPMIDVR